MTRSSNEMLTLVAWCLKIMAVFPVGLVHRDICKLHKASQLDQNCQSDWNGNFSQHLPILCNMDETVCEWTVGGVWVCRLWLRRV